MGAQWIHRGIMMTHVSLPFPFLIIPRFWLAFWLLSSELMFSQSCLSFLGSWFVITSESPPAILHSQDNFFQTYITSHFFTMNVIHWFIGQLLNILSSLCFYHPSPYWHNTQEYLSVTPSLCTPKWTFSSVFHGEALLHGLCTKDFLHWVINSF